MNQERFRQYAGLTEKKCIKYVIVFRYRSEICIFDMRGIPIRENRTSAGK